MTNLVYGVDVGQEATSVQVRDALVEGFSQAHCEMVELGDSDEDISREYCVSVVKDAFDEVGGDFENPTKEKLIAVIGYLAKFSEAFRRPEIIQKHSKEIMSLVNKL